MNALIPEAWLPSGYRLGLGIAEDLLVTYAVIRLLMWLLLIAVAVMTVTAPLLPLIAHDFQRSVGAAGLVISAFAVPYGGFQIVFGPLGDRAGKLRVVSVALGTSSLFVLGNSLRLRRFLRG